MTFEFHCFTALWNVSQLVGDGTAQGVKFGLIQSSFNQLIETTHRQCGLDHQVVSTLAQDHSGTFIKVVFIYYVTDDLLQHILDRHQTGNTTIFINDKRHVIATTPEFLQQHVESFAFRYEHGFSEQALPGQTSDIAFLHVPQNIFRKQNTNNRIPVSVSDRESRMRRRNHDRQNIV